MQTITLEIPNISCGHCVHTIRNELSELEGVSRVEPSLETKQVEIEFSPPATQARIVALLTEINYPPKI